MLAYQHFSSCLDDTLGDKIQMLLATRRSMVSKHGKARFKRFPFQKLPISIKKGNGRLCGETIKTDFTGRDHIVCHRREIYHNHWHCLKLTHLAASNIDCSLELQHFIQKRFFSKNEFENVGQQNKNARAYILNLKNMKIKLKRNCEPR